MATHKPLCYCVMHNGSINKDKSVFERPDMLMHQHLKALYIMAQIGGVRFKIILIDCVSLINVMPHSLLMRIGKYDTNLKSNNMILSNYEGKTSRPLSVIQVDVVIGTTTRPTLFIVVPTKENYNLLFNREWIHGVGCVPSSMH